MEDISPKSAWKSLVDEAVAADIVLKEEEVVVVVDGDDDFTSGARRWSFFFGRGSIFQDGKKSKRFRLETRAVSSASFSAFRIYPFRS